MNPLAMVHEVSVQKLDKFYSFLTASIKEPPSETQRSAASLIVILHA